VSGLSRLNLVLRGLMEAGVVVALASWGFSTGGGTGAKLLLGLGAPLIGFGFWGAVDFRGLGSLSEVLRLLQELIVSGLAAVAWYVSGRHALGAALAGVSIVHHVLTYALGERLLEPRPGPADASG
jgi:Protein of unknown function (DUF2568)